MKVLFLNPPFFKRFSRSQRSPAVTKGGTFYYPYWLAYAAGVLEGHGIKVKLLDAVALSMTVQDVLRIILNFAPSLIVVDTSTPSIFNDISVSQEIKSVCPEAFLVLVGTHPSTLPGETLNLSRSIDAVARGEYDFTLLDLAETIREKKDLNSVDGLSFRENGRIVHNKERPLCHDLDQIPFVSEVFFRQNVNVRNYYFAAADYPMMMLITGRGCPYHCIWCVYPQTMMGRKYRQRSPENIVTEFEYICENFKNVKEIVIEDDTFTVGKTRVRKFCDLLTQRNTVIKWTANVRPDLDFETMKAMKEAGCRLLIAGFESGSQEILNNIRKRLNLEQSIQFMSDAKKAGLLVHGCFVVGNPGETKQTMEETLDFAFKLSPDSAQFYPVFVYPGTEVYVWAKENGFLRTKDYSRWITATGAHDCVLDLPGLPAEELMRFCERAYRRYHLNGRYFYYKLKQALFSPAEGRRTLRSAYRYVQHFLKT